MLRIDQQRLRESWTQVFIKVYEWQQEAGE